MSRNDLSITIRRDGPPDAAAWRDGVTLAAFGDLMLAGEWDDVHRQGGVEAALSDVAKLVSGDLVFANLEATTDGDDGHIAKEPRLVGERECLRSALLALGVDVACLANNHAFDAHRGGFLAVRDMLDEAGILHLGAGLDAAEASRPLVFERRGVRFGLLAYTARDTKPSHVAAKDGWGVNPLDEATVLSDVARLKPEVDHVLVSLHWGVEYCHLPSPEQVETARRIVDAGVPLVIGHHAHVVQGVEAHGEGAIVYNLGNAVTTDLFVGGRLAIRATPRSRSSFVLRAAFSKERLEAVELVPTFAHRGRVEVESATSRRILEAANRKLALGVSPERWKRVRLFEDVVLRTLKKLHPRVIASVRPKHFANFFKNIATALGGRGPA